ncbi:MAG: stage V sporulation protein SpoVM [Ruminococcaceae bacterium]|nr:stage V sporulation protein SpoVM [Oscillospiraceae bacterium]
MLYFQEASVLKVVLIENPRFISFLLRKIYKIKKQKPQQV